MKALIKLILKISDTTYNKLAEKQTRNMNSMVIALILSLIISVIIPIEIIHSITGELELNLVIPSVLVWVTIVLCMDILLLRKSVPSYFRIGFSLAVISITAIFSISALLRKDINNDFIAESQSKLLVLKSNYNTEMEERYIEYHTLVNQKIEYHNSICVPEAKNIKAGDIYRDKHSHCENQNEVIKALKDKLDAEEEIHRDVFNNQSNEISTIKSLGLFEQVKVTVEYIINDRIYQIFLVLILMGLFCIESIVFFTSLKLKKDPDGLDHILESTAKKQNELNKEDLEKDFSNQTLELNNKRKLEQQYIEDEYILNKLKQSQRKKLLLLEQMDVMSLLLHQIQIERHRGVRLLHNQDGVDDPISKNIDQLIIETDEDLKTLNDELNHSLEDDKQNNVEIVEEDEDESKESIHNILYCTAPMKALAEDLYLKSSSTKDYVKRVFEWIVEHITYQDNHNLDHYKTARESFNSQQAICGEMAMLFIALTRFKKIKSNYVHVDFDNNNEKVNHACAVVKINEEEILVDPAYKTFNIVHRQWHIVNDSELIKNMNRWNR